MSCLPKPVLRGHVKRTGLRNIIAAFLFAGTNSSMYYFFVKVPREQAYENFLKSYDPEAHAKDLIKWGYYQCVPKPDA